MDFFQQKKKQQYLILAIVGMVIITAGILFYGNYSKRPSTNYILETKEYKKPIINWEVLEDPALKELQIP
ncbi:hypothetical protein KAW43_02975 [Candidatus Parcubacteria bacterium]|jgi:hypothetical protein|nr:hypothetical protein [Candidatus Parcubacteria bacterium]